MNRLASLVAIGLIAVPPAQAQDVCAAVASATVLANDGTFLGRVENKYRSESIFNKVGTYGSTVSAKSIWNEVGKYGGEVSAQSPFNEMTRTPPALVKQGRIIAYLSVNQTLRGAINPHVLKTCEFY